MGLLGRFGLGFVPGRLGWQVFGPKLLLDVGPSLFLSHLGHVDRVGAHIGDETDLTPLTHVNSLVELLGHGHGAPGGEAQPPRGFLLHGAGGERGRGPTLTCAFLDFGDNVGSHLQFSDDLQGVLFVLEVHLLAMDAVQFGHEAATLLLPLGQLGFDGPVLLRHKGLYLPFTLDNEAHGNRLHPSGGEAVAHPLPQERADLVAHQSVQDAPGLLSVYQIHVDIAGMGKGLSDGALGDLVEDHAASLLPGDARRSHEVPGDGLALTVGVGGQVDLFGLLHFSLELLDHFPLLIGHTVAGFEVIVHVHAQL